MNELGGGGAPHYQFILFSKSQINHPTISCCIVYNNMSGSTCLGYLPPPSLPKVCMLYRQVFDRGDLIDAGGLLQRAESLSDADLRQTRTTNKQTTEWSSQWHFRRHLSGP